MRFRLRSSARDESADAHRLSSIERVLSDAIAEAELEKKGLKRQLESARDRASALLGNEASEYLDRELKSEQLLFEAEHDLIAGERRIRQLTTHLEHLGRVLDLLRQKTSP